MSVHIPRGQPRRSRLKRCVRCRDWQPLWRFDADRSRADGHRDKCKDCRSELRAANGNHTA